MSGVTFAALGPLTALRDTARAALMDRATSRDAGIRDRTAAVVERVRRDGDVIRIELPGSRLFETGAARLRPGAANMVADVAGELRRNYPDQIIGIEGHTDDRGKLAHNIDLSDRREREHEDPDADGDPHRLGARVARTRNLEVVPPSHRPSW